MNIYTTTKTLNFPYKLIASSNPTSQHSRLYEIYQEEIKKLIAKEEEEARQHKEDLIQEALDL